ncbi:hypothetical protein VHA01S_020_00580 [Vibrio halioticoli NBRC 102217]|uniref:Uncharacterized protein n=1 Tax=Vibrio halioticoli NBRC 102217 TaxID=1219072 RepID=V5FI13_9VIBR|nr:hypothetical protein [Vibrio halioticoli]GAD89476.1 hypothetical protein VHA01S_020_00580 [Vibrio halioticoli NBRC 102217]
MVIPPVNYVCSRRTLMYRCQQGLSLLELVLSLGLSSVLLVAVCTLLVHQQQLLAQQIKHTQRFIESHYLASYLRGEVRRAGYQQLASTYIEASKLGLGYQDEQGGYRRILIWRDAAQYKLKYCADSTDAPQPLAQTCSENINYSMLNDKLLSFRQLDVIGLGSAEHLIDIEYGIAIKGESSVTHQVLVASRNIEFSTDE